MKKIRYPKTVTLEYSIEDFSTGLDTQTAENIASFDCAANLYNFEFKDGVLTEGVGFEDITMKSTDDENSEEVEPQYLMPDSDGTFKGVAHYKEFNKTLGERRDKIFLISGNNQLYHTRIITPWPYFSRLENLQFQETPKVKSYHDGQYDCIVIFNDTDGVRSWNNQNSSVHYQNMPKIYDFCEYKGRTFAILSGERLYIRTDATNMLTWEEIPASTATTITLESERGYANKLLSFNGYLFVIRDFGVTRINWHEGEKTYNLSHILCSGSKMYANTACVCGDRGIVLCKDGIYEFDNLSAKKLNLKLNRMLAAVSNQSAVASYRNGIYYLACRLNFGDNNQIGCENDIGYINNALVCYDVQSGKCSICRGVDISALCTIQQFSCDKLYACFGGTYNTKVGQITNDGKIFGNILPKHWCSPLSDLGYSDKMKYVKEVSLLSLYDIKLKVFSETEEREFDIKGGNIISRVPVRIKGKQIGVSISSTAANAYVSNLKLFCNLIENEYVWYQQNNTKNSKL